MLLLSSKQGQLSSVHHIQTVSVLQSFKQYQCYSHSISNRIQIDHIQIINQIQLRSYEKNSYQLQDFS